MPNFLDSAAAEGPSRYQKLGHLNLYFAELFSVVQIALAELQYAQTLYPNPVLNREVV